MRLLGASFLLSIALLQGGCVVVTSFARLEPQLEQWEVEQQYGRSLDALSQIDPKDPDYARASAVRKQVEKQAADYEQQVRKETARKLSKGEWAAALDQYDEALGRHPKSVVIRDGLAKLHQQQRETLEQLERQRLIQHGAWLRNELPVYREIARVDPRSSEAQDRLKHIIGEAEKIAQELALIGNRALADNDPATAEATLPLAYELNKEPLIEESLKTLRSRQQLAAEQQRTARRKSEQQAQNKREKRERTLRAIVKRYDAAFAKQDFLAAREQLAELEKADPAYSKLASLQRTLQQAVDHRVSQLFDAGVSAYSRGQFEQAAHEWRDVLKLDPGHQQARENLERAEKVLHKIESLKQKQGGIVLTPPPK
jgi:tetratricopeptide (TPR) repeat protein